VAAREASAAEPKPGDKRPAGWDIASMAPKQKVRRLLQGTGRQAAPQAGRASVSLSHAAHCFGWAVICSVRTGCCGTFACCPAPPHPLVV
jgi:hypothetical protein